MYLSRLILNPRSAQVRRDIANCVQLHRTILSTFPQVDKRKEMKTREAFEILYRLDWYRRTGTHIVLVQSKEQPDWSSLPKNYLLNIDSGIQNPETKNIEHFMDSIEAGSIYRFRLRANPTRKISTTNKNDLLAGAVKSNGMRVSIRDDKLLMEWMNRKANDGGFILISMKTVPDLPDVLISPSEIQKCSRNIGKKNLGEENDNPPRKGIALTFDAVIFEGKLRVSDKAKFTETVKKGIGSGKGFGFGLLSIAPIP